LREGCCFARSLLFPLSLGGRRRVWASAYCCWQSDLGYNHHGAAGEKADSERHSNDLEYPTLAPRSFFGAI